MRRGCEEGLGVPCIQAALEALSAGIPPKQLPYLACFLHRWDAFPDAETARRAFTSEVFLSEVLYGYLARAFERDLEYSLRSGVTKQWQNGRHGEAALLAYQRTGDTTYIELYIDFFDRLMLLRDSQLNYYDNWHEKVMDSWGSYNLAKYDRSDSWVAPPEKFAISYERRA